MKKIIGMLLQLFFGLFPIQENKILFETVNGEVKDHLKAVYDYCKENQIKDFQFKWVITKGNDVSQISEDEIVYRKTFGYYYHLMTSKYWIRTHSVSNIVSKRKEQIYIQMWHSPGATKKEGFDMEGVERTGEPIFHAKEWDYFIATDEINAAYIKSATDIKIPRLVLGSCRTDAIVNVDKGKSRSIREQMGVSPEEKLILYAPTFREKDFDREVIDLDIKKLCKLEGVRVILRLHPQVKNRMDITAYDDSVIDGNKYTDIFDLYYAADILITDYSSLCIEYALLNKPILYYMYDLEDYLDERGFYFNFLDHLSGPIIQTEDKLIEAVQNIEQVMAEYADQYKAFQERYNSYNDGQVTERFVTMLQQGYFKERKESE